jgi:hypothetical protein
MITLKELELLREWIRAEIKYALACQKEGKVYAEQLEADGLYYEIYNTLKDE